MSAVGAFLPAAFIPSIGFQRITLDVLRNEAGR